MWHSTGIRAAHLRGGGGVDLWVILLGLTNKSNVRRKVTQMEIVSATSVSGGLRDEVDFRDRRQPIDSPAERSNELDMETLPPGQLPQNTGYIATKHLECHDCSDSLDWELCWRVFLCVLWGTASLNTHVSHLHIHYGSSMYVQPYKILLLHIRSGDKVGHTSPKFTISLWGFAVVVNARFIGGCRTWLNKTMLLGAGKRRGWQKQLDGAYCKRRQSPPNFRWSARFRPLNWIRVTNKVTISSSRFSSPWTWLARLEFLLHHQPETSPQVLVASVVSPLP